MPEVKLESITPHAEDVIERACRTCYLSFDRYDPPGSTKELIRKIIRKGHHSVMEHASATFRVVGASRVFTHEMVRHRFVSPSQESQRYCIYGKTKDFEVVVPPTVKESGLYEHYLDTIDAAASAYEELLLAGVPAEDARYVLPNGTTSEIVLTANLREWRHVCALRCHPRAHWEIRQVCMEILEQLTVLAPNVFFDFKVAKDGMSAEVDTCQ